MIVGSRASVCAVDVPFFVVTMFRLLASGRPEGRRLRVRSGSHKYEIIVCRGGCSRIEEMAPAC
jgi:hypothetical protein